MEIRFVLFIHCLVAVSLSEAQTDSETTAALKSPQSTGHVTLFNTSRSSGTDSGTVYTNAVTGVRTPQETTVRLQTTQSTVIMTRQKERTSQTTPGPQTAAADTSTDSRTTDVTETVTADSPHTVHTTLTSEDRITHGSGLSDSERNLTIIFTAALGTSLVALVLTSIRRCKHRVQYLHRPLNDTDNTDAPVADDKDTLVISGGLYGNHPIYDNVPGVQEEPAHFRLDFLH